MSASPNPTIIDDRRTPSDVVVVKDVEFPPAMTQYTIVATYTAAVTIEQWTVGPDGTVYGRFGPDLNVAPPNTASAVSPRHPGLKLRFRVIPSEEVTGYCVVTAQGYAGAMQ